MDSKLGNNHRKGRRISVKRLLYLWWILIPCIGLTVGAGCASKDTVKPMRFDLVIKITMQKDSTLSYSDTMKRLFPK